MLGSILCVGVPVNKRTKIHVPISLCSDGEKETINNKNNKIFEKKEQSWKAHTSQF